MFDGVGQLWGWGYPDVNLMRLRQRVCEKLNPSKFPLFPLEAFTPHLAPLSPLYILYYCVLCRVEFRGGLRRNRFMQISAFDEVGLSLLGGLLD